jgi:hypothetical protein
MSDMFKFQADSFMGRLLVQCTIHMSKEDQDRFFEAFRTVSQKGCHEGKLEIDGISLPLNEAFEWLESAFDDVVKREAVVLIKEKLENLDTLAIELSQRIENISQDLVFKMEKEFGLEHSSD